MASSPVEAEPFCITLANSPDWVADVVNDWPGPIAHEYDRLRRLLQADQLLASVWQLKDVAEVLIRFPACVMARDILEHGSDRAFQDETRRVLLGPPMTMGSWQRLAETLAAHIVTHDGDGFFAPQVAGLFWTKKGEGDGKGTPFNRLANALTAWRNESFGHGAFRADLTEFEGELKDNLGQLHRELGHHRDAWQGLVLQRDDGTPLTGAASIVPHAPDAEPAHAETSEPLALVRDGGGELVLAPYVQLRRCTVCDCRDVFLFDWRKTGGGGRDRYRFIDYRAGHGNPSLWSQEQLLDAETGKLGSVPDAGPGGDGAVDADYTSNDVNEMLAERATAARYRTPEYLRRRLETFLREQEAGVWWLRAPGHTGKSTFVSGLDPRYQGDLKEARFAGELADLAVVAFYIRREYQTSPEQLADQLTEQLKAVLNVAAGARALPQLDLKAADPGPAMVAWLQAMRAAGGGRHRLLVCIDGLDELAPGTERSITDFIPAPASLPEGLFFVVTSRPLGEMAPSLAARLPAQLRGAAELEVGLDDPDYRALLRAYFDDRLAKRRELEALQKPQKPHDFDRLFEQVLAKSDGRFLYLSYLADRLADLTLKLDGFDELPSAEGLFKQLLDDIEGLHAGSPLEDLFRRILLHLAVVEAAFEADRQQQPAVAQEIWHGLPLELLARRVEGSSDGAVSLKLAYALYTLKPTLGSWKGGEGRHASFQLGLKGLAEVIGARWPDELRSLHARLAQGLIERLTAQTLGTDTATELDADDSWTLAYVVAHLQLGGIGETISEDARELLDSRLETRARDAEGELHYRDAVRWSTRNIWLQEASATGLGEQEITVRFAALFENRGRALAQTGDLPGSLEDYRRIVDILERLRQRLGADWAPELVGGLAEAYSNRGDALSETGDLAGALEDYGRAIAILEELQERPGERWVDLADHFAAVYFHRGDALSGTGDVAGALGDYGRAIAGLEGLLEQRGDPTDPDVRALAHFYIERGHALRVTGNITGALEDRDRAIAMLEGLRERLGDQWPPDSAKWLAAAYANRGDALEATGDIAGALDGYGQAIAIHESLRERLGDQWPPDSAASLANLHSWRGHWLREIGDLAGALEDDGVAIAILESLRERLGEEWPPKMADGLAGQYRMRAETLRSIGDRAGALEDHDRAIAILEGLRKRPGAQWSPDLIRRLGAAYGNRGIERETGDLAGALEDDSRAIEILEGLRERLGEVCPPDLASALAAAYANRGYALSGTGDLAGALEDYGRAIAILKGLRERLGDQWPPDSAASLAHVYGNRGHALSEIGDLAGALEDYGQSITILEGLREHLGDQSSPDFALSLANVYGNRGLALRDNGDLAGALGDYDRAISVLEGLRKRLGDQSSPDLVGRLAEAYTNRGRARRIGDLAGALEDHGLAIAVLEGLRKRLGDQWSPDLVVRLAAAYGNRGDALRDTGDPAGALEDHGRAITMLGGLRERLGDQWWPAGSARWLAEAYTNRGRARETGDLAGALEDYDRAIAILEGLRERLGEQWSPHLASALAAAYASRAGALRGTDNLGAALDDFGRAIEIHERLRKQLGDQWPADSAEWLSALYTQRGRTREIGDLAGALEDHGRAIAIIEGLRERLGDQWPPDSAERLAAAYANRGGAREIGDLAGALEDYDRALAIIESMQLRVADEWSPESADRLAAAYGHRGRARHEIGDQIGALGDSGQAIAILERLQERLGDHWLPVYDEHLRVARELQTAAASSTK